LVFRAEQRLDAGADGRLEELDLDAVAGQHLGGDAAGRAIDAVGDQQMVAGLGARSSARRSRRPAPTRRRRRHKPPSSAVTAASNAWLVGVPTRP